MTTGSLFSHEGVKSAAEGNKTGINNTFTKVTATTRSNGCYRRLHDLLCGCHQQRAVSGKSWHATPFIESIVTSASRASLVSGLMLSESSHKQVDTELLAMRQQCASLFLRSR